MRGLELLRNISNSHYDKAIKDARELLFSHVINEILGIMDLYEQRVLTDEDIVFLFNELPKDMVKDVINLCEESA
ncbi:MAG: hypothetical protein ACTSVA_00770 [Candidatus Njordarchaeales archaeon]